MAFEIKRMSRFDDKLGVPGLDREFDNLSKQMTTHLQQVAGGSTPSSAAQNGVVVIQGQTVPILISESQVIGLVGDLALKAPINNPTFTGAVLVNGSVGISGTLNANGVITTGQPLATFNGISPLVALGDLLTFDGSNNVRVPMTPSSSVMFLGGKVGLEPFWTTPPVAGLQTYWFSGSVAQAPSNSAWHRMVFGANPPTGALFTITSGSFGVGNDQLVTRFVSDVGFPTSTFVPDGVVHTHIHARQSAGIASSTLHFHLISLSSLGVITLLETSDSVSLTGTFQEFDISLIVNSRNLQPGDRLGVQFETDVTGVLTATIQLQIEGNTDPTITNSRVELPSTFIDTTGFVPYAGATSDLNLGLHNYVGQDAYLQTLHVSGSIFVQTNATVAGTGTFGSAAPLSVIREGNSDTVPFLQNLNSGTNYGWGIFNRSTEGDLTFGRRVGGSFIETLRLARASDQATFAGTIQGTSFYEQTVTFTPTIIGWYRILTGTPNFGATVRIRAGLYDNTLTDIEFQTNLGGFGTDGAIQATKFSSYNNGMVDQARISNDGAGNCYLDVHVRTATSPQPVTVLFTNLFDATPVAFPAVGATVGSTTPHIVTFGHGFRTTSDFIGNNAQFIGTENLGTDPSINDQILNIGAAHSVRAALSITQASTIAWRIGVNAANDGVLRFDGSSSDFSTPTKFALSSAGDGTFAGVISGGSVTNGLNLTAGNDGPAGATLDQILLGWHAGPNTFRHSIKTRHDNGVNVNNAFDFYTWHTSQGSGAIGDMLNVSIGGGALRNNFTSGFFGTGWNLDQGVTKPNVSYLELDNLRVRGQMDVYSLSVNQINAPNGTLWITDSAKVDSIPVPNDIIFQNPSGSVAQPFAVGDLLMSQIWDNSSSHVSIRKSQAQVTAITVAGDPYRITVSFLAGSSPMISGDPVVRVGSATTSTRQGSLFMTADDVGAPYMRIIDQVSSFGALTSASVVKAQLGQLSTVNSQIFGSLPSSYGLYTQQFYAEGNAQIAGSLACGGGASGSVVGNTFFVGKMRTNLLTKNSELFSTWDTNGAGTITDNVFDATSPGAGGLVSKWINRTNETYNNTNELAGAKTFTFSLWIKGDGSGGRVNINILRWTDFVLIATKTTSTTTGWQRISVTGTANGVNPTNTVYVEVNPIDLFTFYTFGAQFENGSLPTLYQKHDGSTWKSTTDYGVWMSNASVGGTMQNPAWTIDRTSITHATAIGGINSGISIQGDTGLGAGVPSIVVYGKDDGSTYLTIGGSVFDGSWHDNTWGQVIRVNSKNLFRCYSNPNGSGLVADIAGWAFNDTQLSSSNLSGGGDGTPTTAGILMNSGGYISGPNFALGTSTDRLAGFTFNATTLNAISNATSQIIGGNLRTNVLGQTRVELNGASGSVAFVAASGGVDQSIAQFTPYLNTIQLKSTTAQAYSLQVSTDPAFNSGDSISTVHQNYVDHKFNASSTTIRAFISATPLTSQLPMVQLQYGTATFAYSMWMDASGNLKFGTGYQSALGNLPTLTTTLDQSGNMTVVGGFGCNTKASQTAFNSGGALAAYGAGANGFDTAPHAQALYNLVVAIRTALVNNGIMS